MATKAWAIGLMVICTLLTSVAQTFYKSGADSLAYNFRSLLTNYNIGIGLFLYAIGAVIMIIALKGGEVSVLYPIIATSYIWVAFLSLFMFNENLNIYRWAGIVIIVIGIILINMGSREKKPVVEFTEGV